MFDLCVHIFWLVMATNSRGSHDLLCDKAHSSHAGLIHKNTTKNKQFIQDLIRGLQKIIL